MLLSPQESDQFFRIHRALMCFVNDRQEIISDIQTPDEFSALPPMARLKVREAFLNELDLIKLFVDANPFDLSDEDLEITASWQHQVSGKFFLFRQLKQYMVFLTTEEPSVAYGVRALTDTFEELVGPSLPVWAEAVLLPFKDKIVYDGLLGHSSFSFGPGIKRGLNASYKEAKERLGIITSLPAEARPVVSKKPSKKAKSKDDVQDALQTIVQLTDSFCRDHLNDEYAVLCRKLAEKLARKRPSPLLRGRPQTWASGIVRTIGWVNFLDDRTQQPHMRLTAIDEAFDVGQSTGQRKSTDIRRMLKIKPFSLEWTLPSQMHEDPMIWMVEVNGYIMDIRNCPLEIQELAFRKGLIPFIPAAEAE